MIYNFYLDGIPIENPIGWDQMISSIKRDKVLKGLFLTMDVTFTFTSTGFLHLKNLFNTSGYCAESLLKIEQSTDEGANFYNFYDGIIKISDVEFMLRGDNLDDNIIVEQYAKVKVLDNSFFSKIFNNRKLKTNICAGKTKNNLPITPCPVQYLRMFEPSTGIAVALDQKEAILWFDVFKYLIEFMTDAEVEFDSNLFKPGTGDFSEAILTYGLPIWNQGGGVAMSDADFIAFLPLLDFDTFFHEIDVRANLGLYIDNSGQKPKVRIERWDDLFLNDSSVQINNINSIKTRISVEDIFSRLKLGTTETLESLGALQFPETINYIGFKEEEYIILGKCNIDTELDLTGEFIVSSNVIEEILINNPAGTATPNKAYNDKFFLIDAENIGVALYTAKKSNWLDATSSTVYYNERFTNANVANNFLKAVPNDLAAYLGGILNADFLANKTFDDTSGVIPYATPSYVNFPLPFDNDTIAPAHDAAGVYDNGTYQFTVPALGAGQYSFYAKINSLYQFTWHGNDNLQILWQMRVYGFFRRYDSIGNFIAEYQFQNRVVNKLYTTPADGTVDSFAFDVEGSATINLNDGDIITVKYANDAPQPAGGFQANFGNYKIWMNHGSIFSCTGNTTGGGNYQKYDPSDYPIIEDSFEQELSKTQFDLIASRPLSLIEFSQNDQSYKRGWIDELRYDHEKGIGTFKLLSAKNTN